MLNPQTRATLTDRLRPSPGFVLEQAVTTTFTLDLVSALSVPLSFATHRISATDDSLGLLDALRRTTDRVDVFAQAGQLSLGAKSDLFALLEPMVHPVALERGVFHPKVWFLEYSSGEEREYRFLSASRNLTSDRSWDLILSLDGVPATPERREAARARNLPLTELLRSLPSLAVNPLPAERAQRIAAFAERIQNVEWELPPHIRDLRFYVLGPEKQEIPQLGGTRALIVSPFLTDSGLAALRDRVGGETHVLSRASSLERLPASAFDEKLTGYVLDEAASERLEMGRVAGTGGAASQPAQLTGLHAKAMIYDRRDGAHVLLGSANATGAAWRDNVEVMVELIGSKDRFGVHATLSSLGEIIEEFEARGGADADPDEEADLQLSWALRAAAAGQVTMRLVPGEPHSLTVWADERLGQAQARAAADGIGLRWHLLNREDLGAESLSPTESGATRFDDLALSDISAFIVLVARNDDGREQRSVLLGRVLDDVPERRDAVVARQLVDRTAFLRFLGMVLELNGFTGAMSAAATATDSAVADSQSHAMAADEGLFEALVSALAAGSSGLAYAQRTIELIEREGRGEEVFPGGFRELWDTVLAAARGLSLLEADTGQNGELR